MTEEEIKRYESGEISLVYETIVYQLKRILGNLPIYRKGGGSGSERLARFIVSILPQWYIPSKLMDKVIRPLQGKEDMEFIDGFLKGFGVEYTVEGIENIPDDEPLIFVSNHPNGFTDALTVMHELIKLKRNYQIVANDLLEQFYPVRKYLLGVNITNTRHQRDQKRSGIKQCMDEGRDLYILPAGHVSRMDLKGNIRDVNWKKTFVNLAVGYDRSVVPVYIESRNSRFFYDVTRWMDGLGKTLLMRELSKPYIRKKRLVFGRPIHSSHIDPEANGLSDIENAQRVKDHLYSIGTKQEDVLPTYAPGVEQDIKAYGTLLEENAAGGKQLYLVDPATIQLSPQELVQTKLYQELGRLRNETFAMVNQQTEAPIDVDPAVDGVFSQLIVWDPRRKKIAGGYRVAFGKDLLAGESLDQLYNKDLFHFSDSFTPTLEHSIELGRSFVAREYQFGNVREATYTLKALWEGIHRFVQKGHERGIPIRYLFGSVSIDPQLHPQSVERIIFMYSHSFPGAVNMDEYVLPQATEYVIPENRARVWIRNFGDKPYKQRLNETKAFFQYHNDRMPILFHHYAGICETGGVNFGRPVINRMRNNCVEVPLLLDLAMTKESQDSFYGKGSNYSILEYLSKAR